MLLAVRTSPIPSAALVGGVALAGVASALDGGDDGLVFCVFRRCTGGYCPGCGGSRAVAAMLRGDLSASWAAHPWVPLIAVQLVVLAGLAVRLGPQVRSLALPVLTLNVVLGMGVWVVRLWGGAIPVPFA